MLKYELYYTVNEIENCETFVGRSIAIIREKMDKFLKNNSLNRESNNIYSWKI